MWIAKKVMSGFVARRNGVQLFIQRFFAFSRNIVPVHVHQRALDGVQQNLGSAKTASAHCAMKKARLRQRSIRRRIEARDRRAACGAMSSRSSRNWSNVSLTGSTVSIMVYAPRLDSPARDGQGGGHER